MEAETEETAEGDAEAVKRSSSGEDQGRSQQPWQQRQQSACPTSGHEEPSIHVKPQTTRVASAAGQGSREARSRETSTEELESTDMQYNGASAAGSSFKVTKAFPSTPDRLSHPGLSRSFSNQSETGVYSPHSETPLLNSFSPPLPNHTLTTSSKGTNPLQPTISAHSHTHSVQTLSSDTHPGYSTLSHAHSHLISSPQETDTSPTPRPRPPQAITLPYRPTSDPYRARSNRHSGSSPLYSPIFPLVFQPALNLDLLRYHSLFARFHHLIYPLLCFGHVPITLFLDYTVIYALAQIAVHPYSDEVTDTSSGFIAGQPRSNLWWIALGFYALSTLVWLLGVVLIHDVYYCYIKRWNQGHPPIMAVYLSAPAYNLSCIRSYATYCCLWRLRLSAFSGIGTLAGSKRQALTELSHHYMQNWPTIITLIPRAASSLILILAFTSTSTTSDVTYNRDGTYFRSDGTISTFSIIVNLINISWAVYRLLLVALSAVLYLCLSSHSSKTGADIANLSPRGSYTARTQSWTSAEAAIPPWRQNLRSRIVEAVLLCSSSQRWRVSRDEPAYRKSRSSKPSFLSRKSRGPTNIVQNGHRPESHAQNMSEEQGMRERRTSEDGYTFYIPVRPASAPQPEMLQEHSGNVRFSSIPMRHKRTSTSTESTAPSIAEYMRQAPTGENASAESFHVDYERPLSSLGHHFRPGPDRRVSLTSFQLQDAPAELDEEELERLEWEKHPPLTPKGSLVQAREELAHQNQQRSYWHTSPSATGGPSTASFDDIKATSVQDRALGAITEESEEEASLRRANSLSNRHTISSRQSSLRRPDTALGRLDESSGVAEAH